MKNLRTNSLTFKLGSLVVAAIVGLVTVGSIGFVATAQIASTNKKIESITSAVHASTLADMFHDALAPTY